PVDDVILLPDGELRIRRNPRGFADAEIGRILAAIEVVTTLPPGSPADAYRDYLPGGAAPGMPGPQGMPMPGPQGMPMPGPQGMPMAGPPGGPVGGPQAPQPDGCDVVLQTTMFSMPQKCSSCGGPKHTTLKTSLSRKRAFGGTVTRSFAVPYCNPCAKRVSG